MQVMVKRQIARERSSAGAVAREEVPARRKVRLDRAQLKSLVNTSLHVRQDRLIHLVSSPVAKLNRLFY